VKNLVLSLALAASALTLQPAEASPSLAIVVERPPVVVVSRPAPVYYCYPEPYYVERVWMPRRPFRRAHCCRPAPCPRASFSLSFGL
jgi:hypothetical protein